MQPALFYVNGIVEGGFGLRVCMNPKRPLPGIPSEELHDSGVFYAQIFGPVFTAAAYASILMAKKRDSGTKQLFGAMWMVYHLTNVIRGISAVRKGKKQLPGSAWGFHMMMSLWFAYYLKKSSFDLRELLPFK